MPTIQIRECLAPMGEPNATISFDGVSKYSLTLHKPTSTEDEEDFEWYFEEWLRMPFVKQRTAQAIVQKIERIGYALFEQIFADRRVYAEYDRCLQAGGAQSLRFEIIGSPEFNAWPWESLRDPKRSQPLAVTTPMLRKNRKSQALPKKLPPSPTLNLLIVTARPQGKGDVGYRTVSRPLLDTLRHSELRVKVDLLRPGTYESLVRHLEQTTRQHGAGYYHIIHFDTHGAVMKYKDFFPGGDSSQFQLQDRFDRLDIHLYHSYKAFLFLENDTENRADPVEASELAKLLTIHDIPMVVLNACKSGKQIGAQETSLGALIMQAGVRQVLAMAYSVTISAAAIMMPVLYRQIFQGQELGQALIVARAELWNRKARQAYFNQHIDLEDWLLPVLYEDHPSQLQTREFTPDENRAWCEKQGNRYSPPPIEYGFQGRDLDVLEIERSILKHNLLLIHGMAGAGKTSLLHHLAEWWQTTGWVDEVFYFGYDERGWTAEIIIADIAQHLLGKARYYGEFNQLSPSDQRTNLAGLLCSQRHLLIVDNIESTVGEYLSVPNTLSEAQRQAFREFLALLVGGKTFVLLGSRSREAWLATGTFGSAIHELAGLDAEAASNLAEKILEHHNVSQYRDDLELQDLLKLLSGYPLALLVVLSKLKTNRPSKVLAALRMGDVGLDRPGKTNKTESLLACIDYAYGYIETQSQKLLLCLAPFTSVLFWAGLPQYTEALRRNTELENLPFSEWKQVLEEAEHKGLLRKNSEHKGFFDLQPIFPYFLRGRLNAPGLETMKTAVEMAFNEYYENFSESLYYLLKAQDPKVRKKGLILTGLEYENLYNAMEIALARQKSFIKIYTILFHYTQLTHNVQRGLRLGEHVLESLEMYPAKMLLGDLELERISVADCNASLLLSQNRYSDALPIYQMILKLLDTDTIPPKEKLFISATTSNSLGIVAQQQRQWAQAKKHYQSALAALTELNDIQRQASVYFQLGTLAEEQRQWKQADKYLKKALTSFIESDNHGDQADTYHHLGILEQDQRKWELAKTYFQKELAIRIGFNDRNGQAKTYHSLGGLARDQKQWNQAESYYQDALAINIELSDRYGQAQAYHELGTIAMAQQLWSQAEAYYLKAQEIYHEF